MIGLTRLVLVTSRDVSGSSLTSISGVKFPETLLILYVIYEFDAMANQSDYDDLLTNCLQRSLVD